MVACVGDIDLVGTGGDAAGKGQRA